MTINTFTAVTFMVYFLILYTYTVKVEFLPTFQLVDDLSHSRPKIKQKIFYTNSALKYT